MKNSETLNIAFQFGNIVSNTPIKRRKLISQEIVTEAVPPLTYQNSCESVILNCRSIRIGTLRRMVVEPVIVSKLVIYKLPFWFWACVFSYLNSILFFAFICVIACLSLVSKTKVPTDITQIPLCSNVYCLVLVLERNLMFTKSLPFLLLCVFGGKAMCELGYIC